MLAIGRALHDQPEAADAGRAVGGAGADVVETMIETIKELASRGRRILLIEQNLGVATSLAERQLVMVGGEIAPETTGAELERDTEMQRRYLGVEPVAHA